MAGARLQRARRAPRRRAADHRARGVAGERVAAQPGAARAAPGAGPHRGLRDRRAHHARAGPEAADLLGGGAAAPEPGHADRGARHVRGGVVPGGVRRHGPHPRGHRLRAGPAGGTVRRRGAGAAAERRRRSRDRADPHPADRPDGGGAPRVHPRRRRARGHVRHDQLRRGAAGGLRRPAGNPCPARLPRVPVQRPRLAVRTVRAGEGPAGVRDRDPRAHHARGGHHPPGAGPDRVHHRGPGGALARGGRPGDLPAGGRAVVAVPVDAVGGRGGPDEGGPPGRGRPGARRPRPGPAGRRAGGTRGGGRAVRD